jgi:1-acyl-sn-glycerol-3-phosphate acyltransferase
MLSALNSWAHFVPLALVSPVSRARAWAIYSTWLSRTFRIFGITISVRDDNGGDLGPGPHLYVWLNQSSLAEAGVFPQVIPPHYKVINAEYAAMPLLGWASTLLRDQVIVQQWKRQAKHGIERAAIRLARGERFLISIEGTRSTDGSLHKYKKGPIVMAVRAQGTIVPIVTHGGRDVLPRGEWRVRPGNIELHILKTISTRGLSYEDRNMLIEQLRVAAEEAVKAAPEARQTKDGLRCADPIQHL